MYLLDTNHCSYILEGNLGVTEHFRQLDRSIISTCIIVQSELLYMAHNSQQKISNLIRVEAFLKDIRIYEATQETAAICGYFRSELMKHFAPQNKNKRRKFKLSDIGISINDLWIAAIALQHDLTLVSADQDFVRMLEVQKFRIENWLEQP
jgi:tRNA(fMet)-specific endonuclease VapC